MRTKQILIMTLLLFAVSCRAPVPQFVERADAAQQELPPLSWTCPMHPDILEAEKSICPICKMDLEPTRLDLAYSCPLHPVILEEQRGQCPIDGRDLVQVTVAVHWACSATATEHFMEPGKCPDGGQRTIVRELRAHGDHNSRHGGVFFMAADNWHHLEGTYPRAGLFRVFFYDNFTQPIDVAAFTGRAVTREGPFDPATKTWPELETFPLKPSVDGTALEASLTNDALPLTIVLKVMLKSDAPEQRFDFTFDKYSKEPTTTARDVRTTVARVSSPTDGTPSQLTADAATISEIDASAPAEALPKTSAELLERLSVRSADVRRAIQEGRFDLVYIPASLSKDIALALEGYLHEVPDPHRAVAASAIRRLVLASWQLDFYGDRGDGKRLTQIHNIFAAAVDEINHAYAATR